MNNILNVVILGSGCAGNTAAIYAARANLKPLVIEGHEPGGQLSLTTDVENFPGFPEGINGPELVAEHEEAGRAFRRRIPCTAQVREADLSKRPFRLELDRRRAGYETRTLIIASGASARWLGSAQRAEADRPRRQLLRHLRRVLLSRARKSWSSAAAIPPWKKRTS